MGHSVRDGQQTRGILLEDLPMAVEEEAAHLEVQADLAVPLVG